MFTPRNRLLFWVAVVVLPMLALATFEPRAALWACLVIGGLAAAVAADAVRGRALLEGVTLKVPDVARLSQDRQGILELHLGNPSLRPHTLTVALQLPESIRSAEEAVTVALPAGAEWSRLAWPCQPALRGRYDLRLAGLEAPSQLGFWNLRRRLAVQGEIRVYPNLAAERKNLAALFLNRGMFGIHAQRQVGKGRDFEKLREYVPGDSFDEIHWKATARRGRPITKVFQIEKTQEIYVVLDSSRLAARAAGGAGETGAGEGTGRPALALDRYITAALTLGLAAEQQGDLFGLVTFSDKVDQFLRARNGKAHYSACRDTLYTLQPTLVSPDFDELSTFLRLRLRRRALLLFLTALDDPALARSFVRQVDLVARQHLVVVNMIQPPGVAPVFSSGEAADLDQVYEHLGGHLRWQKLRELEKVLQRRGVRFSLLQNERLSADLVSQYLQVKRRQML